MNNPSVIHVVGNRPQFIKLAVLFDAIAKQTSLNQFIIHTGQHYSEFMSNIFFDELSIPKPDVQFDMRESSADEFIGRTSARLYSILNQKSTKDLVLVYGDTNSTLAAAIAATRSRKVLIHFESGVRTNNKSMPEEINRVLTDRLSDVHYCCTQKNRENLLKEGFGSAILGQVLWTGDLMLDAFLHIAPSEKKIITSQNYIACTIHRVANISTRQNLSEIVLALNELHKSIEVVIPLHPHTAKRLKDFELHLDCKVIDPLGYQDMKSFICNAGYVITDSGGASREAFFAKKRSVIVMDDPFWKEIIEAGAALHCGSDHEAIIRNFKELDTLNPDFDGDIFGKGKAAAIIAKHLNTLATSE